jgi:hypothetical protein
MKYLNIWKDIHVYISEYGVDNFLSNLQNNKEETILMCAEEASLHAVSDVIKKYKLGHVHMVNGGYDINYYNDVFAGQDISHSIWPFYFLYETFYHNNTYNLSCDIECLFLNMNYRPRLHRKKLIDGLQSACMLEKNYFTWHNPRYKKTFQPDFDEVDYNWKFWTPNTVTLQSKNWDQYSPPIEMYKSAINLVTESFLHCGFITEKTWNSIICKRPFIILGAPGIHKHLHNLGFELSDKINYNFDSVEDTDTRINLIVQELERLNSLNVKNLYESTIKLNEHNYNKAIDIIKTEEQSIHVKHHYSEIINRSRIKAHEL